MRELNEDTGIIEKWMKATCEICGDEVEFGFEEKKRKQLKKSEYEIRDGKHFLRIDGVFKEVELCKVNKRGMRDKFGEFLKVMPVIQTTLINYTHKTF